MKSNYMNNINENLILMENIEDKEKRHECDLLMINQDVTSLKSKMCLEDIKNNHI